MIDSTENVMTKMKVLSSPFSRVVSRAGLGVACMLAASLLAGVPVRAETSAVGLHDTFRIGWYHNLTGLRRLPEIAETNAPLVMPYDDEELTPFLDRARELGIDVLPEIPRKLIDTKDYDAIAEYVAGHDAHPAVLGWYSADEPGLKKKVDWSPPVMESVYKAIRSRSQKPVYLCFSYVEMDRGDVLRYRDSFDVMLVNHYPYVLNKLGEGKASKELAYWKELIAKTAATARELDRPWLNILQAIGPRKGKEHQGWRLPTLDEARFQLYWSILHDADGALYFCYYWVRAVQPSPGEPFEEDGRAWLETVFKEMSAEFEAVRPAVAPSNRLAQGVESSHPDVRPALYRDPAGESFVLVAANGGTSTRSVRLKATLPSGGWRAQTLVGPGVQLGSDQSLELELAANEVLVARFSGEAAAAVE